MLLNARTTNGTGDWVTISHDGRQGANPRLLWVSGALEGATVAFEHSFDGGASAKPDTEVEFTAADTKAVYLVPGQMLRAVVAGGSESGQSISCGYI